MSTEATSGAYKFVVAAGKRWPVDALTRQSTSLALLVESALAGDMAAFEQIMIHSEQKVMRMSWRMLGNEADARDATQEVFLRVYKYLDQFKQDRDFFAWVYKITLNVCRSISKKRRNDARFTSLDGGDNEETLARLAQPPDAEEALLQIQRRELLIRAMATITEKERAALLLRDLEGFDTDEVARIMSSSPVTVRSHICSARKKIKVYCERYLKKRGATVS